VSVSAGVSLCILVFVRECVCVWLCVCSCEYLNVSVCFLGVLVCVLVYVC